MSRNDTHEVSLIFQAETAAAVWVREVEDGPDLSLPLSQIEISCKRGDEPRRGDVITITAPEWLLEDRGLL